MIWPSKNSLKLEFEYIRILLLGGGPADTASQNVVASRATANIRDREMAARLAEQLVITLSFHHLFAGMIGATVGPCKEALSILAEIEAASVD